METGKNICALCAWRETCQKRFSVSGRDMRCADFAKDLRIREEKEETQETK